MFDAYPLLDPWDAAELAQQGPYGDGTWGGIDPSDIKYGTPIETLFNRLETFAEFLEAAPLAGHLPITAFEGLRMLLKGHQRYRFALARGALEEGDLEQAMSWLSLNPERQLMALLEDLAAETETRLAALYQSIPSRPWKTRSKTTDWGRHAEVALRRAKRAARRRELIEKDVRSTTKQRKAIALALADPGGAFIASGVAGGAERSNEPTAANARQSDHE